jgi:hypothetical protein
MTHIRVLAAVLVALVGASGATAQEPKHVAEMKRLDFLVGRWQGEARYQMGPGQQQTVSQTEIVETKLGGAVLAVEGIGKAGGERVVHHAFAVLAYDAKAGRFTLRAHKADGSVIDVEPQVGDRTLVWGFPDPRAGQIRYTVRLTERGEWHEVGEASRDGATWHKFMEMTLARVGESAPAR